MLNSDPNGSLAGMCFFSASSFSLPSSPASDSPGIISLRPIPPLHQGAQLLQLHRRLRRLSRSKRTLCRRRLPKKARRCLLPPTCRQRHLQLVRRRGSHPRNQHRRTRLQNQHLQGKGLSATWTRNADRVAPSPSRPRITGRTAQKTGSIADSRRMNRMRHGCGSTICSRSRQLTVLIPSERTDAAFHQARPGQNDQP